MAVSYRSVVECALALPGVVESTSYGTPALKVRDKLMVRLKEDARTVVLRTTWEDRERLMAVYPDVFFFTEHYRKYPWVLFELARMKQSLLAPVVLAAWRLSAPKALIRANPSLAPD